QAQLGHGRLARVEGVVDEQRLLVQVDRVGQVAGGGGLERVEGLGHGGQGGGLDDERLAGRRRALRAATAARAAAGCYPQSEDGSYGHAAYQSLSHCLNSVLPGRLITGLLSRTVAGSVIGR